MIDILWGYQKEAVRKAIEAIKEGHQRILFYSPTGSGKGMIISYFASSTASKGFFVDVFAHKIEILKDLFQRCFKHFGVRATVVAPNYPKTRSKLKLHSVATTARRGYDNDAYLVIVDECHRIAAPSYREPVQRQKDKNGLLFGFTATATRTDGISLADYFTKVIVVATTRQLIDAKYLVPERIRSINIGIDTSDIKITKTSEGLDYDNEQMAKAFVNANIFAEIVNTYKNECPKGKALVYHVTVANAEAQQRAFEEAGITAFVVSANTKDADRNRLVERFSRGLVQVIINVGLYVEGVDLPVCDSLFFAFDTLSESKYIQCAGRGARPIWNADRTDWARGEDGEYLKPVFTIYDFGGNVWRHGRWSEYDLGGFSFADSDFKAEKKLKMMPCVSCGEPIRYPTTEDVICPACGQVHTVEEFALSKSEMLKAVVESLDTELELVEVDSITAFISKMRNIRANKVNKIPISLLRSYSLICKKDDNWILSQLLKRKEFKNSYLMSLLKNREDIDFTAKGALIHMSTESKADLRQYLAKHEELNNVTSFYRELVNIHNGAWKS